MAGIVARELKQTHAFGSREEEVLLGLRIVAARIVEPWEKFLKATADLTPNQYNVLRILRGSHPTRLPCGDIAGRMIARDPDVTRLVDRLSRRGLVTRVRGRQDRRESSKGGSRTRGSKSFAASTRMSPASPKPCSADSGITGPPPTGAALTSWRKRSLANFYIPLDGLDLARSAILITQICGSGSH